MFSLGWGVGGGAWEWRRQLWVWEEEMLGECQALLYNFTLQVQSSDRWIWRLDPLRGYTVRGAYQILTSHSSDPLDKAAELI
ncbi:receptor-like protein kinase ANXUR2 [Trifolium medium]|uniref:Receptor-like protein kinase ANXUR2 n=1 Tax=Trifolium medium TaxID=97028 RepID=A0A392RNZ3_9FABA|nr:receptor-like protein kinase ANXUR2 [Trifolium medium]